MQNSMSSSSICPSQLSSCAQERGSGSRQSSILQQQPGRSKSRFNTTTFVKDLGKHMTRLYQSCTEWYKISRPASTAYCLSISHDISINDVNCDTAAACLVPCTSRNKPMLNGSRAQNCNRLIETYRMLDKCTLSMTKVAHQRSPPRIYPL